MYLLIVREKDNKGAPAEILDVRIVSEKDYDRYAQRAAELNKSNKQRHYSIEKHDDNSLVAFLATDRQYDMSKYSDLAAVIRSDIAALEDKLFTLGIFYREAAEASGKPKEQSGSAAEPQEQEDEQEQTTADNHPQFVGVSEERHAAVVARKRKK